MQNHRRIALRDRYVRSWGRGICHLFGIRRRVEFQQTIPSRPYLLIANHRSALDIPVLLSLFGGVLLSHHGVLGWPILGFCARHSGTIFVDRRDPHSGAKALRGVRAALMQGSTVIIFPEGTTFHGDNIRPFRKGALAAARITKLPIVPVGIVYDHDMAFTDPSFAAYMKRMGGTKRVAVTLEIGSCFEAGSIPSETEAFAEQQVQALVYLARKAHKS